MMWQRQKNRRYFKPFVLTKWLCLVLLWVRTPVHGDVVYFSTETPPVSGRLIEENPESIIFQIRLANGATKVETFAHKNVSRIIRTINQETLANLKSSSNSDILAYAETLLGVVHDFEAQYCGQELLTELLTREPLENEWKTAIYRLKIRSLPPGLARERLRRQWSQSGVYPETHRDEENETDPWIWYTKRLAAEIKRDWLRALRADRTLSGVNPLESTPVPRAEIQVQIRQTQAKLAIDDPVHHWAGELLAILASDDFTALVALARLEAALQD